MDKFECKKILDGLWELGEVDLPEEQSSDSRVRLIAQWLADKSDNIIDLPLNTVGFTGWHSDRIGYILIMAHDEPGTEFAHLDDPYHPYNTFADKPIDLEVKFIAKPKHIYLSQANLLHRGSPQFGIGFRRCLSRVVINLKAGLGEILKCQ